MMTPTRKCHTSIIIIKQFKYQITEKNELKQEIKTLLKSEGRGCKRFPFLKYQNSSFWAETKHKRSSLTDKFSFPCFFNIMVGSSVGRIKVMVIHGNNNIWSHLQFNCEITGILGIILYPPPPQQLPNCSCTIFLSKAEQ